MDWETESEKLAVYTREYTALPLLQPAARVEYALLRRHGELCAAISGGGRSALCPLPGLAEPFARALVRYLFENGIPPQQLREVVQDACAACLGAGD